ncbi:MAG: NUDIX domain-containing protein [Desulfuromonadaceae bacterium]
MDLAEEPRIKVAVVACILDAQQRVLLTRRCIEPFRDLWVMPGGKIEAGESIAAALQREVREEVGIEVRVEGLIDLFEQIGVGEQQDHFIILYYRARPLSLDLQLNADECSDAAWVAVDGMSGYAMPPGGRYILGKLFPDLGWAD